VVEQEEHGHLEIDIMFRLSNLAIRIAMAMRTERVGDMEKHLVGAITIL
jgi:hypothetical protein